MTVDHRLNLLDPVKNTLSYLIYPIEYVSDLPRQTATGVSTTFATRRHLQEELARLQEERLILEAKLQRLATVEGENMRLRALLQSAPRVSEKLIIGEILAVDLAPFSRRIVVDKGTNHNIYLGQPVINAEGVIGQTVEVGAMSSKVMLITDPSHGVPVRVNRNGLRAVVIGRGRGNQLAIPNLPNNADIEEGDLLVTSGLGGRFPSDYPVATVTEIVNDPGEPFAIIRAEPTAGLEEVREVLMVWPSLPVFDFSETETTEAAVETTEESP